MSRLQDLPNEIKLNIAYNLSPEDLLRFGESSPDNLRIISDPYFLRQISERDFSEQLEEFGEEVTTLDQYRRLAGRYSVTRDSPQFYQTERALQRASQIFDTQLINQFVDQLKEKLIKKARFWNDGLKGAALGGHVDLAQYFINAGADNLGSALEGALSEGHVEMVKFLLEKMKDVNYLGTLDLKMGHAMEKGGIEMFKLLLEEGVDLELALIKAAGHGNVEMMKLAIEKGAGGPEHIFPQAFESAVSNGQLENVKFLANKVDNIYYYDRVIKNATLLGYDEIADFLKREREKRRRA